MIPKYAKGRTKRAVLAKFPELAMSTLKRILRGKDRVTKDMQAGFGRRKRFIKLKKYKVLGDELFKFFVLVRILQKVEA